MSMERTDLEASHDFYNLWLKAYEATYGKIIDMPSMGPSRENAERMGKHLDITVNLYSAWMESIASFQTVFMEATRRTREKVESRMAEEDKPVITSKEYYELWMETYSEAFKEFMKSKFFSSDLSKLTSNSMDYEKSSRELVEQSLLKPLNLPTRREIDDINKEVYLLKKQMKSLSKRLDGKSAGR
jgi:class III poly(R)-hydroxyalkanoic acid synthase PhaE subunit